MPSIMDVEWAHIDDVLTGAEPDVDQQLIWELKKKTLLTDPADPASATYEAWLPQPSVGFWDAAANANVAKTRMVSRGLGHRYANGDIVANITKSGALYLDILLQRIINNQSCTHTNDYGRLYAVTDFLNHFATDKSCRLTSFKNRWDPTDSQTATMGGDSAFYILPSEKWVRAYGLSCSSFVNVLLDDKPVASYFLQTGISSGQWQITANINGGSLTPGADYVTTAESPSGKQYNLHHSYGFGNGFAMQSTEPMACGGLVFCEKGQKLSLQVADIFSGRAWSTYVVSLTKDAASKWNDPSYECFDWTTNQWKNGVTPNGYFLQIANCKVY